jgi:hypothetical protein
MAIGGKSCLTMFRAEKLPLARLLLSLSKFVIAVLFCADV